MSNTITVCLQGKDWVYSNVLSHYKRVQLATAGFVQDTHKDYFNILFCHHMAFPVTTNCTLDRNLKRNRLGSNLNHDRFSFALSLKMKSRNIQSLALLELKLIVYFPFAVTDSDLPA